MPDVRETMKLKKVFLNSFRAKVTFALIFSLLFITGLDNLILYEYNLRLQFKNLQEKLKTIASTAAIDIDASVIKKVPLNKVGKKGSILLYVPRYPLYANKSKES